MKMLGRRPCYGKNVHTVELTPEENEWPDAVLITTADNHGNSERAWKAYRNREHPGHFFGRGPDPHADHRDAGRRPAGPQEAI